MKSISLLQPGRIHFVAREDVLRELGNFGLTSSPGIVPRGGMKSLALAPLLDQFDRAVKDEQAAVVMYAALAQDLRARGFANEAEQVLKVRSEQVGHKARLEQLRARVRAHDGSA